MMNKARGQGNNEMSRASGEDWQVKTDRKKIDISGLTSQEF